MFQLRFGRYESAAAVLRQAADFEDATGASNGRVDVQGGCGVHGVASLCGGRVRRILTQKVILSMVVNLKDCYFLGAHELTGTREGGVL